MKLRFKHQKFQADAAKAVVEVFAGQPFITSTYMIDKGNEKNLISLIEDDFTGYNNAKIIPALQDNIILEQLQQVQRENNIEVSKQLEGHYNLTIEMETGVGKTYTYIKTMYELNRVYGWSKFIVVVPSVAIREGVFKSFQITESHFAEEYGKKIRYFIYNSSKLNEIDVFASDNSINVMIINSQAFNATGQDARRIYMELDEFRSRRPIDVIAKTNPIVIIDEPQSVEGKITKAKLKEFNPLFTLRYSATHKADSVYNMVYRLDAIEAYNKKLVKKIAVKGITKSGNDENNSYVYLESINLSKSEPTATIQFDCKTKNGIRQVNRIVKKGYNLYDHSGGLEEYKDRYIVANIDGRDNSIEFLNGIKIYEGDVIGDISEDVLRRIQIRETILSHIERERALFNKGIKVLSLFFIDEVAKYRVYEENGVQCNGLYAQMFEEEYSNIIENFQREFGDDEYIKYLNTISPENTHAGYFSIDKAGHLIDSKVNARNKEKTTDDVDAYDLIMKNKELLLDRNPERSPVRFIFSHSALREGWDNPNVFQICTLKQSTSEVRKRQEVGRGLRLCVNEDGERMDQNMLGNDVHNINVLTVIASESYDSFAKGLQSEIAEAVGNRPITISKELFVDKVYIDTNGNKEFISSRMADAIIYDLIKNDYIDINGCVTDKYYKDRAQGSLQFSPSCKELVGTIDKVMDSIYDSNMLLASDARNNNIELDIDQEKLSMSEFKSLWEKINTKTVYSVNFDTDELVDKAIHRLNVQLRIAPSRYIIETGSMESIESKELLKKGQSFTKETSGSYSEKEYLVSNVKYDLIGKLVEETGLTRKTVVAILKGIEKRVFDQFKTNPEEFIIKAGKIINDEKATAIIEHITYDTLDETYSLNIFTEPTIKGKLDVNAMKTKKHLYNHLIYDSTNEANFAKELDISSEVAVYVKLPKSFYISTPVGKYNPDWAIAFYSGTVKHVYFIAETKGSLNSMDLRLIEGSKIHCAREHFKAISNSEVVYDVVDNYQTLLDIVTK